MNPLNLTTDQKQHACELYLRHDASVKDYGEDFELQTALRDYLEEISGEKINIGDMTKLCDDCYEKISLPQDEGQERRE